MQERLIREMVKLRGGPTKLKTLCKEYEEQIKELRVKIADAMRMRELIIQLTSDDDDDVAPLRGNGEEDS